MIKPSAVRGAVVRGPAVTYTVLALCCLVFLVSPVSGLNPSYGTGDALLAAQSSYFARWGVIPNELTAGDPGTLVTPSRRSSCTATGCTCWGTCSSSTSSA